MSSYRKLLWFLGTLCFGALCLFRLVVATTQPQAIVHYNDGDIWIGFRATDRAQDYLIDIGQPSQIVNGQVPTGPMAADLAAVFGSDWYTRVDPHTLQRAVLWSIVSGRTQFPGGGDPGRTLYSTNPLGMAWPRHSSSTQGVTASLLASQGIAYDGSTSTTNKPKAVVQQAQDENSYAYFQPGGAGSGGISYQTWNPTNEGYPPTTLTLCRITPGTGPSTILGTLSLSANGVVLFTPSGNGTPTPTPTPTQTPIVTTNPATLI